MLQQANNGIESDGLIHYKGYSARPEYSDEDGFFFGELLGINDCITFGAESKEDFECEFHKAVDDYLELCAEIGKEPQKPMMAKVDKKEALKHLLSLFPEKGLDIDPEQTRDERLGVRDQT